MKKLSKVERFLLEQTDRKQFNTYRCDKHGIYQVRKNVEEEKQCCAYCKEKHPVLTEEQINDLLT